MDRFAEIRTFVAIAEAGGLSTAGRRIGATKSVVSRRLSDLEARVGAQLAHRTPRSLSLTLAGERFYERSIRLLADLREAEEEAATGNAVARGRLRISAPMTFGTMYLGALLKDFTAAYPDIELDVDLDDRVADLAAGGQRPRHQDRTTTGLEPGGEDAGR